MLGYNVYPEKSPWRLGLPTSGLQMPPSFFKMAAGSLVRDIQGRMDRGVGVNNLPMVDNSPNTRAAAGYAGQLGKEKRAGNYGGRQMGARTGWKRKRPSVASGLLRSAIKVKEVGANHAVVHIDDIGYHGDPNGTTTLMTANFLQSGTSPHVIRPLGPWLLRFPTSQGIVFAKQVNHPGTVKREFFGISPAFEKHILKLAEQEILKIIDGAFGK